jgi:hypothetical protein
MHVRHCSKGHRPTNSVRSYPTIKNEKFQKNGSSKMEGHSNRVPGLTGTLGAGWETFAVCFAYLLRGRLAGCSGIERLWG